VYDIVLTTLLLFFFHMKPSNSSPKISSEFSFSRLIGSHSHQLGCFDAESGAQRWQLQLSDRIEAGCACAVIDGQHRVFAVCGVAM
jgi:hypothetical protein